MSHFLDRIRDMIFDPELMDEEMDMMNGTDFEEEMQASEDTETMETPKKRTNKVVAMDNKSNLTAMDGNSTGAIKMVLFQPMSYEDSQAIVDNLRANKPVIVNMVDLERECAQRVLDFMAGAVYALNGTIRRVSYGIFVIVPHNVIIVGQDEQEDRDLFRS